VCADVAKWLRTRTKSRYDGMKIKVPPAAGFLPRPPDVMSLTNDDSTVVVKCLNRASGSLAGVRLSNRANVCFGDTGSGTSEIAPVYTGVALTLPATFCMCEEKTELISGVT